ncbi:hypothetical protein CN198_14025 [Sinorhizobium meliloti]|uniref:hypothetical protein n=1 Tax=Rhizobium meliloti TaxID=382 RepID=UPI000FD9C458|nr:hypothetical protein [Sinorhizobium meliloti]RVH69180.1 hypothetical protein CN198_14025 [Sinorhizobium meliloti]
MQTIDKSEFVLESLHQLTRQVPTGADRDPMEAQTELLRREARLERRWKAASAARLNWKADLVELAAQIRHPVLGSQVAYAMRDRVVEQLRAMCGGYASISEGGAAIRQALKMTLARRRIQIADIAPYVGAARERPTEAPIERRPFEVIDGRQSAKPLTMAKFG